jgi:hypothetical protein
MKTVGGGGDEREHVKVVARRAVMSQRIVGMMTMIKGAASAATRKGLKRKSRRPLAGIFAYFVRFVALFYSAA